MSNVRSLNTEVQAREAVAHLRQRAGFMSRYQRQQEVVQEAEGRTRRAVLQRTNRFLGRPSVGVRLTARGARNKLECGAIVCRPPRWLGEPFAKCTSSPAQVVCSHSPHRTSGKVQSLIGSAGPAVRAHVLLVQAIGVVTLTGQCCSRPCGNTAAPKSEFGAGAGEYARTKWRLSAPAARMHHAVVAGI